MQYLSNRNVAIGLGIALLTALSAIGGAPQGFDDFKIPVWNILLQFNLCTGFVFLILGVLESVETPTPNLQPALQLLATAFVAYGAVHAFSVAPIGVPASFKLFLFALSLACLAAGWARFGLTVLKQLDK